MKLNLEQLKQITYGAVSVNDLGDYYTFSRMTPEQLKYYENVSEDWYKKALTPANVKLRFKSNTKNLRIKVDVAPFNYRYYFSIDVLVDGKYHDSMKNFDDNNLPKHCQGYKFPIGEHEKNVTFDEGEKVITVIFPWSVITKFLDISIDDGATVIPCPYSEKILIYGDSITQGCDSLYSRNTYVNKLLEHYNFEGVSKAIGGERYCPEFAKLKDNFTPKFILVSYGSNDWYYKTKEQFVKDAKAFMTALRNNYGNVKIIALSPIWRANKFQETPFGDFEEVYDALKGALEGFENLHLIKGRNFVDENELLFLDYTLHPNDEGFEQFFNRLKQEFDKVL